LAISLSFSPFSVINEYDDYNLKCSKVIVEKCWKNFLKVWKKKSQDQKDQKELP